MKRFFAAYSAHGTATSDGFANDWQVLAFSSRVARDVFVARNAGGNRTLQAIPARLVTARAANWDCTRNREHRPRPFSGEFWGIVQPIDGDVPGLIGRVEVCDNEDHVVCRLYR